MTVEFLKNVSYKAIVSSSKTLGAFYIVEKLENEEQPTCTCPDNSFRGGLCKHITAVRGELY